MTLLPLPFYALFILFGGIVLFDLKPLDIPSENLEVAFLISGLASFLSSLVFLFPRVETVLVEKAKSINPNGNNDQKNRRESLLEFFQKTVQKKTNGETPNWFLALSETLQAGQGLLYEVFEKGTLNYIRVIDRYATLSVAPEKEEISFGEGLTGTSASQNKIFIIPDMPSGYLLPFSPLGQASVFNLVIIPFTHDGKVILVSEFASFLPVSDLIEAEVTEIQKFLTTQILNHRKNGMDA